MPSLWSNLSPRSKLILVAATTEADEPDQLQEPSQHPEALNDARLEEPSSEPATTAVLISANDHPGDGDALPR
ncbi:hypothetical protein LTR53_014344 [Teratosphaeriaceae sp. CCFEE 6253]|nr:hypothetical protein LTR53_014344 [Teratosphaeriaceae sp. CCFEE 6253]